MDSARKSVGSLCDYGSSDSSSSDDDVMLQRKNRCIDVEQTVNPTKATRSSSSSPLNKCHGTHSPESSVRDDAASANFQGAKSNHSDVKSKSNTKDTDSDDSCRHRKRSRRSARSRSRSREHSKRDRSRRRRKERYERHRRRRNSDRKHSSRDRSRRHHRNYRQRCVSSSSSTSSISSSHERRRRRSERKSEKKRSKDSSRSKPVQSSSHIQSQSPKLVSTTAAVNNVTSSISTASTVNLSAIQGGTTSTQTILRINPIEIMAQIQKHQEAQAKAQAAATAAANNLPKYYNPSSVNAIKFSEQQEKRKLLWSKKSAPSDEPDEKTVQWTSTSLVAGKGDAAAAAKFRKLMGIHDDPDNNPSLTINEAQQTAEAQAELFRRLEHEYEASRVITHGQRGAGLGFASNPHSIDYSAYAAMRSEAAPVLTDSQEVKKS